MPDSPPPPVGVDTSPWQHLLAQTRLLHAILDEAQPALQTLGLDPKGFFLLASVEAHPSPAAVARALILPKPTATALIKRAEAAGHLERGRVAGDLRRFSLTLTPSGRSALRKGEEILNAVMSRRLSVLAPHEKDVLLTALLKMI